MDRRLDCINGIVYGLVVRLCRAVHFSMRAALFFSVMRREDSAASTSNFSSGNSNLRLATKYLLWVEWIVTISIPNS